MRRIQRTLTAFLVLGLAGIAGAAEPTCGETGLDIVFIRKDCGTLPHCFEDDPGDPQDGAVAANQWIWSCRQPSQASPLLVELGPGRFDGAFQCLQSGHVSFRGAGRKLTTLDAPKSPFAGNVALFSFACDHLSFQDMTIEGLIYWVGAGLSSWVDVDVGEGASAWYDICEAPESAYPYEDPVAEHFWWNSRIDGTYLSECGLSWFYGTEHVGTDRVVAMGGRGDARFFGSTIEKTVPANASDTKPAIDIGIGGPLLAPGGWGHLHFHGGRIRVDASAASNVDVTAIRVYSNGGVGDAMAHTPGTVFELIPPASGGSMTRLAGDGKILSPALWPTGPNPPVASLGSRRGQDLWVETGCDASGDCDDAGTEPHLMIFRDECGAENPWWDSAVGACRPGL